MQQQRPALEKCPRKWIEMHDLEKLSFAKATWIPLYMTKVEVSLGKPSTVGHRKDYQNCDSVIVPIDLVDSFKEADWQSISRHNPDGAWANNQSFFPPGCHMDDPRVLHPVIRRSFDTGEPAQWDLLQELEVGLRLLRKGDLWTRPEENDTEIAKIERHQDGSLEALLFRAEHLRDYLCAKKASLLLAGFSVRDAVEERFPCVKWTAEPKRKKFKRGEWEGFLAPIHEGGGPYGEEINVLRVWRESVDPSDDLPEMPMPQDEPEHRSESFKRTFKGRKIFLLNGRIWTREWIHPGEKSPRIRRDEVESRVPFQVDNQAQKTMAGSDLEKYRGWLWFKPSVFTALLAGEKGTLEWFTLDTGEAGSAPHVTVRFGVNNIGLINVLGRDMAQLPEWAQKIWAAHNVSPEGGLSPELHMAQNLANPADTTPPEPILFKNLSIAHRRSLAAYGQSLFQRVPSSQEFYRRIHRFHCNSFDQVCALCKELHRTVSEPIDMGLLNSKIDPANAEKANKENLRQIKRLALWLDSLGEDGRKITRPLAGVADLRQGDAHTKSSELKKSLELFDIPPDAKDLQAICCQIIGQTANCIGKVANALLKSKPSPRPNT
jgi:hypothetical protein